MSAGESVSDDLMWRYHALLTDLGAAAILERRNAVSAGTLHPKQAKIDLARRIVADFHSPRMPNAPRTPSSGSSRRRSCRRSAVSR